MGEKASSLCDQFLLILSSLASVGLRLMLIVLSRVYFGSKRERKLSVELFFHRPQHLGRRNGGEREKAICF